MPTLTGYGISVDLPPGWEGRIGRRTAAAHETTHAVLHAANFPLPNDRGDFGSGAVEGMAPGDVFIALFEYHPNSTGTALFATDGPPLPLRPDAFSPTMLQRTLPGQAGHQSFFSWNGRAFCLYVVLGAHTNRSYLVQSANDVLASLHADAESS